MTWENIKYLVNCVGMALQIFLWVTFLYYFTISIFGWFKRKEVATESFPIKNRFAVIVAAHNEENVIAGALKSMFKIDYPKDMFDVFVIADNCTDNTAKIAREAGAKVYERFDRVKRGKGFALEWMFKKLFDSKKEYDAICVFDADNLVSTNFLREMNKYLIQGHKVIQGYLDSKNPQDSWIAGNYAIGYWVNNRMFQLARHYLGLSCALGGTGFVVASSVLKEIGWEAYCLTEDLEFSIKLVLKGMRVTWAHEAKVFDEKPLTMKQSWKQRKRWMQGHCDCCRRYSLMLFKKAIKDRSLVPFDVGLYLMQPFFAVANVSAILWGGLRLLINPDVRNQFTLSSFFLYLLLFMFTYANLIFVFIEGRQSKKIISYFITVPIFNFSWVPIIIAGFLDRNKTEWVHTVHTRALDIPDIKGLEKVG